MQVVPGASSSAPARVASPAPRRAAKPHLAFSHDNTVEAQTPFSPHGAGGQTPRYYYEVDRIVGVDPRYGKPARTSLGGVYAENGREKMVFLTPDLARVERGRFEFLTPDERRAARRMDVSTLEHLLRPRAARRDAGARRVADVARPPETPAAAAPGATPRADAASPESPGPSSSPEPPAAFETPRPWERELLAERASSNRSARYAFLGGAGCVAAAVALTYAHAAGNFAPANPPAA